MAPRQLEGMRVAIVVTDDFEQSEFDHTETGARRSRRSGAYRLARISFRIIRVVEPQKPRDDSSPLTCVQPRTTFSMIPQPAASCRQPSS